MFFHDVINCECLFRSDIYILEQNIPNENYSFSMCSSMMLLTVNVCFEVRYILEQNIYMNYSFAMCSSMMLLTMNVCFEVRYILEQNIGKNYSFAMCCFMMLLTKRYIYTRTEHLYELFICYVFFHDVINCECLFRSDTYTRTEHFYELFI